MKYVEQPLNLEALRGPDGALKFQVRLTDLPAGGGTYRVFCARTPDVLSVTTLTSLANGSLGLANLEPITQQGPWSGLRELTNATAKSLSGSDVIVEGLLYNPVTDMPYQWDQSASWDTLYNPGLERSDMIWFVACTALDASGSPVIAMGGLGQWVGQEHLAAVWLSPSSFAPVTQVGDWLVNTIRSFKPVLDWRIAQTRPANSDWALGDVRLTDNEQNDSLIMVFVMPRRTAEDPAGISAPDRRKVVPAFNIRVICYADDAEGRARTLTAISDSLQQLLNTRKYREFALPDGNLVVQAFVSDATFGQVQPTLESAVDLTWSCEMVRVGMF